MISGIAFNNYIPKKIIQKQLQNMSKIFICPYANMWQIYLDIPHFIDQTYIYICILQPGTLDWQYNTRSQQGNNCHIYLQRPVYMRNTWLWHIEKNSIPNKHATWLSKGLVNEPISWLFAILQNIVLVYWN